MRFFLILRFKLFTFFLLLINTISAYGQTPSDNQLKKFISQTGQYRNTYLPGIIKLTPKGYYKTREFYSSNYDDLKTGITAPDLRTTIYWNPRVITDAGGKASVEFFNADGTGIYKVIVEGINEHGHLGSSIL
ncbi:MAG: hypothetical protein H7069_03905 [Phormidesmis sp. FL-bin-119]|nr:hypothetical protein [Pedobacter sp.]